MINLLFYNYVVFFVILFFHYNLVFAYNFFLYLVVPCALLPVECIANKNNKNYFIGLLKASLSGLRQTLEASYSFLFFLILTFCWLIVISTTFQPNFLIEWLFPILGYYFSVIIFILITARLANHYNNFINYFFILLPSIISINGLINLNHYLVSLSSLADITSYRFFPEIGIVPDHWPTTGAVTYAASLVIAVTMQVRTLNLYSRIILIISGSISYLLICLSQSRGPLIASVVSIFFSVLFTRLGKYKKIQMIITPLLVIAFLSIPLVGGYSILKGDNLRFEIWSRFIGLGMDRLFMGYGERLEFSIQLNNGDIIGHAHNIFISAFLRGGLGCACILIFTMLISLYKTLQYLLVTDNPVPFALILLIVISGIVDFDILVFLPNWQWLYFWLPIGLALGASKEPISARATLSFTEISSLNNN
jgi:hypothetical protein